MNYSAEKPVRPHVTESVEFQPGASCLSGAQTLDVALEHGRPGARAVCTTLACETIDFATMGPYRLKSCQAQLCMSEMHALQQAAIQ